LNDVSDEMLMAQVQHGDHDAFARLVDRYVARLHQFALRFVGNPDDADDVVQETFLRVWQRASTWESGRVQLTTWLHRITHNLCIDRIRRRRSTTEIDENRDEPTLRLEDEAMSAERGARVSNALADLRERQRTALLLCHYQGLSNRQAAEILEISIDALESLLARGRRRMRELLDEDLT
jgi:RNA polymerase sigma-70 factor (ECF subfamily)